VPNCFSIRHGAPILYTKAWALAKHEKDHRVVPPATPTLMMDSLHARLLDDRVLFDTEDAASRRLLLDEVERIAAAMDCADRSPPMLWTGIPLPTVADAARRETSHYCLLVSVGGTHTDFAIMRRVDDVVYCIDADGSEVRWSSNSAVRRLYRMATPNENDTESGQAMIDAVVGRVGSHFGQRQKVLEDCRNVILSWGYGNEVYRKGASVVGGIEARSAGMAKGQVAFEADLLGQDIGRLFEISFERQLGWSRPVTVANDGVMALHYFLTKEHLQVYNQLALAIIGTGTNFTIAEPYATRSAGTVSLAGEHYRPRRLTPGEVPRPGENVASYFVNYETCELDLVATKTPFDRGGPNSIEEEAIAGGSSFWHQFSGMTDRYLGARVLDQLLAAWRRPSGRPATVSGLTVSDLGTGPDDGFDARFDASFPDVPLTVQERTAVRLICESAVSRSALHTALILAAVTKRLRFGLGAGTEGSARKDLLGLEGSVWRTPGYPRRVRACWSDLIGEPLRVDFTHEPQYNASLPGALSLLRLHEER
jgi:hypothetical protein